MPDQGFNYSCLASEFYNISDNGVSLLIKSTLRLDFTAAGYFLFVLHSHKLLRSN